MRKTLTRIMGIILPLAPSVAFAASQPSNFKEFVNIILGIIQTLVILIFSITFITILWSLIKRWIVHGGDTDSVEEGKNIVFVGIIVLVIMTSIWGILAFLRTAFFG